MLKLFYTLLFICTLFWSNVFAQDQLPPIYEIKTDTIHEQILDSVYWQKLEDKEGKWTLDEIRRAPLYKQFHIQKTDTAGIYTHWQRYRLKNVLPQGTKIFLTSSADFYDVYLIRHDSSVMHYRSGILRKWDEKDGLKSAEYMRGVVPVILAPGEEITVFDRRSRKNEEIKRITVRLLSEDNVMKQYMRYTEDRVYIFEESNLYEIFTAGLLFISILLSLFFYSVVREKVYLWFALYAFFVGLMNLHNVSAEYTYRFQPEWVWYVRYLGLIPWTFAPFLLIQFIRHFFILRQKYRRWDMLLYWVGILSIMVGLLGTLLYTLHMEEGSLFKGQLIVQIAFNFFIIPSSIIVTSLLHIRNPNASYRNIAYGVIPLMLLYLISVFYLANQESSNPILMWLVKNNWLLQLTCLCWLVLWFVKVLIMRYDLLRKENIQQAIDKERERNELIATQKVLLEKEVEERTAELKQSLEELKLTQSQLIQSEKMASLGELTAGIAHEIQNPLNFVNNFSEVNTELIDELSQEVDKGNLEEVKALAKDIKENEQKINHHGKRADAIVKGMLQHSRSSSGVKEPTDINALCDEYIRLTYHGLRAKDKSFNATMKTDFDKSIGNINIIPQDIGRVVLNLLTNAFYVVDEKKKSGVVRYEPTVSISTKKINGKVEIKVSDNGNGIPKKVLDKIFQPFFTTKPTGQGTGLGLSLSYDIVKAHGGELRVETREGEGSEFIILLPAL